MDKGGGMGGVVIEVLMGGEHASRKCSVLWCMFVNSEV